jgi:hypothetical protein
MAQDDIRKATNVLAALFMITAASSSQSPAENLVEKSEHDAAVTAKAASAPAGDVENDDRSTDSQPL